MICKLKDIREEKNMTREELASKSGVSKITISAIESGNAKTVRTSSLLKIANALGVTVTSIFF